MSRPDYLERNRSAWDGYAAEYVAPGRESWAGEPRWGIWGIPEAEVGLLPDVAAETTLLRPYFGMHRFEWLDDPGVEFHLGYGDWIRLLRRNGLAIEDLVELRPPPDAATRYPFVTPEWARRWPSEEVWKARKL